MILLPHLSKKQYVYYTFTAGLSLVCIVLALGYRMLSDQLTIHEFMMNESVKRTALTTKRIVDLRMQLSKMLSDNTYEKNLNLQNENKTMRTGYASLAQTYATLVELRSTGVKTDALDIQLSQSMKHLSDGSWATAQAQLSSLLSDIQKQKITASEAFSIPQNIKVNNTPPGSGFSQQQVSTEIGNYLVSLVAGDLNSTRVLVDTASDGDCKNDCPTLSLADYVSRSGAYAGINGSYFCPSTYPSCADKKNSFDTLLMNKNKKYFNSDNNVYSTVPLVVFGNGFIRFIGRSLDWGRDTSVDGVLANQPLLISGGSVVFGGDGDPKKGSKGSRSFIANKGNTAYIGVISNVTVAEAAIVLKTMAMDNALNLDSGGSTALWSGGYKIGPGRNIPNAILFIRK